MTKYATIRVTAYCTAQGPIVTDHKDGTVTIKAGGKLVTGRRI